MENKILINNQWFIYIIEYKKIKNIYFRVKDDLKIHVSASPRVGIKYIESLLQENSGSIIKMYNMALKRTNFKDELMFIGNKLTLIEYDGMPYISNDYIYAKDEECAKEYIYSLAFDIFSKRVDRIKGLYPELPNFKLRVRKMKSKWGVCNIRSMSVTLNTDLIFKDVHLIDYVIVHELTHFKHMDHSPAFWKDVSKYYPYYKEARKELNSYD